MLPALHGKEGVLVRADLVGMYRPIERRCAGGEGASPTLADGSAAPSLPTGSDEEREAEVVEQVGKQLPLAARERH